MSCLQWVLFLWLPVKSGASQGLSLVLCFSYIKVIQHPCPYLMMLGSRCLLMTSCYKNQSLPPVTLDSNIVKTKDTKILWITGWSTIIWIFRKTRTGGDAVPFLARRARRRGEKAIAGSISYPVRCQREWNNCRYSMTLGRELNSLSKKHKVGADAWRQTGVRIFDANINLKDKVIYKKIWQHLQDTYHHKFSYGTVIQLCVPWNQPKYTWVSLRSQAGVQGKDSTSDWIRSSCKHLLPLYNWSCVLFTCC